jgi:hypothetical protein
LIPWLTALTESASWPSGHDDVRRGHRPCRSHSSRMPSPQPPTPPVDPG